MTWLQRASVAAGIVETPEDMMERDPQLKHRGSFVATNHPEVGLYHPPGHSYRMPKSP